MYTHVSKYKNAKKNFKKIKLDQDVKALYNESDKAPKKETEEDSRT
jgi:hypothetical protein